MKKKFFKFFSFFLIVLSLASLNQGFVFANDFFSFCESIDEIDNRCSKISKKECQDLLKECQAYFEEKSLKIENDINKTEEEKKSLKNKIYLLRREINLLDSQIYQSNLMIKNLGLQIGDTEESITKTTSKIEELRIGLANVLQAIYEEDQKSMVEIVVAEDDISGFFNNLIALEVINSKSNDLLKEIKSLKVNLEDQKNNLDEERLDLKNVVKLRELQKVESDSTKKQQEYYLRLTEAEYNKQLEEKEATDKQVAEINARIFDLIGVQKEITFGEAYEIAKYVESVTGVRPAFLLAILTQESALGKNVGQCYLPKTEQENYQKRIMAFGQPYSSRDDVKYFLEITKELGRDPYNTPVSCPMSYGWGGAMGPAQFIPTTWNEYRKRLEEIKGSPADPWNIKDAFLASGLYLSNYGAAKKTYDGELNAALSYFAGPGWYKSSYRDRYRRDYGYPVMSKTKSYEADIAQIQG